MTGDQIRRQFLDFFAARDHLVLPSAGLLPDDPTTYFTSAGMQPFVPYFLGKEEPPARRVATSQKCLRGDDLDEVGYTSRHLTFFEMLGNFSFGDYFKQGAVEWAWEFVREVLDIPADLLFVSVYDSDDEAAELWHRHVGVPRERIVRFGIDDNWWGPVGNSGPCGPCSEIFFDRGPEWGSAASPLEDEGGDRYIEIWNLVFQQYNSSMSKAELKRTGTVPEPLPAPGIDTGSGLERVAVALQGKSTVFETDLLWPLCEAVMATAKADGIGPVHYGSDAEQTAAVRRVADHIRALTFAVSDGIFPSNKAGGYVLRQILRRAARYGRLRLGLEQPFLHELVGVVVEHYAAAYPELREGAAAAEAIIRQEEEQFSDALQRGIPRLEEELDSVAKRGESTFTGERAFFVYETFGVPLEVQVEIAGERGLRVDVESFEQVRHGRESRTIAAGIEGHGDFAADLLRDVSATEFVGYEHEAERAAVLAIVRDGELDATRGIVAAGERVDQAAAGESVILVLDRTPFYAESGGQVGDTGAITDGVATLRVRETKKDKSGRWLHCGVVEGPGSLDVGDGVEARIDTARRDRIRRAHTATHLLHAALRGRLGKHVAQAGSLVEPDRLRFDFSHFAAVSDEDIAAIEREVNQRILENRPLLIREMPIDEARRLGALMFFGEKYGQVVRVVNVGEHYDGLSTELCGGTHVRRTGDIGICRVVAESSVGSGVRRIEALTAAAVLERERETEAALRRVAAALRAPLAEAPERVEALVRQVRELEREVAAIQQQSAGGQVEQLVAGAEAVDGVPVIAATMPGSEVAALKELADRLVEQLAGGVALLGTDAGGKVVVVCKASDAAVSRGVHAGEAVKAAAQAAGGGGGGRPQFAQAGGRDAGKLSEAVAAGRAAIVGQLGG